MKKVHASKLRTISMVEGNEDKYPVVIDDGIVKEWVGIGWISLRDATPEDIEKYPTVERGS